MLRNTEFAKLFTNPTRKTIMGLRGPAKKPTVLRMIEGNRGHQKIEPAEPMPKVGTPKPPADLTPEELVEYKRLARLASRMKILTESDGDILVMAAKVIFEIKEFEDQIKMHGVVYWKTTPSGETLMANPAVRMKSDAERRFKSYLDAFGMSPSARTRVRVEAEQSAKRGEKKDEFFGT